MTLPPFHLRPNKAVDRLTFVEAIRCLEKLGDISNYTYYGLGGAYLEEFRLLYEVCPGMEMVSIEENEQIYKRQQVHTPCSRVRLEHDSLKSFLAKYDADDKESIFWLDYTRLEYGDFEDFMEVAGKVSANSMIKITLPARRTEFSDRPDDFRQKFGALMHNSMSEPPSTLRGFVALLQEMLQIASEKALPADIPFTFQPISSFFYSDGTTMLTLTGVVCLRNELSRVVEAFHSLEFRNLDWSEPKEINMPILSTWERLRLQNLLPCDASAGQVLLGALGYYIERNEKESVDRLEQYAQFHRYFPYFIRGIP